MRDLQGHSIREGVEVSIHRLHHLGGPVAEQRHQSDAEVGVVDLAAPQGPAPHDGQGRVAWRLRGHHFQQVVLTEVPEAAESTLRT